MAQGETGSGYLVIRTSVDPYEVLPAAKTAVASVLPNVPLRYITSMEKALGRQTAQRRLNMLMLSLFGLLGLVISVVGVYGVMAYLVRSELARLACAWPSGLPKRKSSDGARECVRLGFRRARPGRNRRVVSRHDHSGLPLRHRVPRPEGISRCSCRAVRCRLGCERHSCAAGRPRQSELALRGE